MANVYRYQGKYDLAEPLYVECLEKSKVLLGLDHPDTLTSMNNVANLYSKLGKCDLAEPLLVECLEKRKLVLGLAHVHTLKLYEQPSGIV